MKSLFSQLCTWGTHLAPTTVPDVAEPAACTDGGVSHAVAVGEFRQLTVAPHTQAPDPTPPVERKKETVISYLGMVFITSSENKSQDLRFLTQDILFFRHESSIQESHRILFIT